MGVYVQLWRHEMVIDSYIPITDNEHVMAELTTSQQLPPITPLVVESFIVPHPVEIEQRKTFFSSSIFLHSLQVLLG